jgi:hypothetical protein
MGLMSNIRFALQKLWEGDRQCSHTDQIRDDPLVPDAR